MHRLRKKIVGYFLAGIIFFSAIALSISFSITNSMKAMDSRDHDHFYWPEKINPPYPVKNAFNKNFYYCWFNVTKQLKKKDYFTDLLNINHFYDTRIALINDKNIGNNLCNLIKLAIRRSPYFQKKSNKLQEINVDYKHDQDLKVNCLFNFDELYHHQPVWYYDQFVVSASIPEPK